MQAQAQVKAAALKRKLDSAKIIYEIQQKINQLTSAIKQQQIQAEIVAAHAEKQAIAHAMEEKKNICK